MVSCWTRRQPTLVTTVKRNTAGTAPLHHAHAALTCYNSEAFWLRSNFPIEGDIRAPAVSIVFCPGTALTASRSRLVSQPGAVVARPGQAAVTQPLAELDLLSLVLHCADSWEVDFTVHKVGLAISFSQVKVEGYLPLVSEAGALRRRAHPATLRNQTRKVMAF